MATGNLLTSDAGLVAEDRWDRALAMYDLTLIREIRTRLAKRVDNLNEKVNVGRSPYFSYSAGNGTDAVTLWLQMEVLIVDVRLSPSHATDLRRMRYEVRPRNNWQGGAGWLTGWRIPLDTKDIKNIVDWLAAALDRSSPEQLSPSEIPSA
jgi:hypothetical protein